MLAGGGGSIAHPDLTHMSRQDLEAIVFPMTASTFAAVSEVGARMDSSEGRLGDRMNSVGDRIINFMQENLEKKEMKEEKKEENGDEQPKDEPETSGEVAENDDGQPNEKPEKATR